jgi:hypothetical protein
MATLLDSDPVLYVWLATAASLVAIITMSVFLGLKGVSKHSAV